MLLIEFARHVVGVECGSVLQGRHVGWTTDPERMRLLSEAGANCTKVEATAGRVIGYEIAFAIGREAHGVDTDREVYVG